MDEAHNLGDGEALKREGPWVADGLTGQSFHTSLDCLPAKNFTGERKKSFMEFGFHYNYRANILTNIQIVYLYY